jgi:stage V sporulation protein G
MPIGSFDPPRSTPAPLEITEVRINPQDAKALLAFVSVTFNDCFVVRGLKIIDGMEGRFVAMPARKKKDNTFQDIAHPITREFREQLETVVLGEYERQYEDESEAEAHPEAVRTVVD